MLSVRLGVWKSARLNLPPIFCKPRALSLAKSVSRQYLRNRGGQRQSLTAALRSALSSPFCIARVHHQKSCPQLGRVYLPRTQSTSCFTPAAFSDSKEAPSPGSLHRLAAGVIQRCRKQAGLEGPSMGDVDAVSPAGGQGGGRGLGRNPSRGAFIVLEGVDRCGKSTQAKRLVEDLNADGVRAELWNFPDRTTSIGQMINGYLASGVELDDATIHLLFSANRWEKRKQLVGALEAGTTLVVDRYAYSGAAFTAAKHATGLDLDWCKAPDKGLPAPDLVLFLDISIAEAEKRGGFGQERYEKRELQQKVLQQFQELRSEIWHVIDAARPPDDVAQHIRAAVGSVLDAARSGAPLALLWERTRER